MARHMMNWRGVLGWLWVAVCLLTGCQPEPPHLPDEEVDEQDTAYHDLSPEPALKDRWVDDMGRVWVHPDAPREEGTLRILATPGDSWLDRPGLPSGREWFLAKQFARSLGLKPQLVLVTDFSRILDELEAGKGDMAVAFITITPERQARVPFTRPLMQGYETLVVREGDPLLEDPEALNGRTITVLEGTTFLDTAKALQEKHPGLKVEAVSGETPKEVLLADLLAGTIDVTIEDELNAKAMELYMDGVVMGPRVGDVSRIGWAIHPDRQDLLKAANLFITTQTLEEAARLDPEEFREPRSWSDIVESGSIRFATVNSAGAFYHWRGKLIGFEYELAQAFARHYDLVLEVEVLSPPVDIGAHIYKGKADFFGASVSITEARRKVFGFSMPYLSSQDVVVGPAEEGEKSLAELDGREIHVPEIFTQYEQLVELKEEHGYGYEVVPLEGWDTPESLMAAVDEREIDLTATLEHQFDLENTWRESIGIITRYGVRRDIGWMLRKDNESLRAKMDAFLLVYMQTEDFQRLWRRHFIRDKRPGQGGMHVVREGSSRISPYDEYLRKWAREHGLDWRLAASQMYQESRFKPRARSWVGAQGLMQIMPGTARDLGLKNAYDPEQNIEAGLRYMAQLTKRWNKTLPIDEATWFALASYNAGYGHVLDAQVLARRKGLNPNKWFGNVEETIRLLADPKYYRQARYGYCRGSEPAHYVEIIKRQYDGYRLVFEGPRMLPEPTVEDME